MKRGPAQPQRKLILRNSLSPGDIVMLTAAVRDLHQCYPNQFLTDVRTSCAALWANNPYLTPLDEHDPTVEIIDCHYPLIDRCHDAAYHSLHGFIEFLNDHLKLNIKLTAFRGDIHLSDLETAWASQVHELTGEDTPFWIIVAGGKYDVTIKWWSAARYQEVVDRFRGKIQFVQVGQAEHYHPALAGVIDLRGCTDLRQLVRLVYHAQGVLCPITCLMHLAAALPVKSTVQSPKDDAQADGACRPCVVVAGGREPVHWEAYPGHQFIHTIGALRCCESKGCWKSRVVALGDGNERDQPDRLCVDVVENLPRCMHMIGAAEVIRRIESYFDGGAIRYLTAAQAQATASVISPRASSGTDNGSNLEPPRVLGRSWTTVLIQQATGPHEAMLDLSAPRHSAYARRHGLTFWSVRGDMQFERPPHWNKIVLIQQALLMGFDMAVWLDADTLIVDPSQDVRWGLPDGPPIGLCRHPLPWNGQPWHLNSGVIVVRNTELARSFFRQVWETGPVEHWWQEQVAILDTVQKLPHAVQVIEDKWNCTAGVTECPDPVIRAWHGCGPRTLEFMQAALGRWPNTKSFARTRKRPNIKVRRAPKPAASSQLS